MALAQPAHGGGHGGGGGGGGGHFGGGARFSGGGARFSSGAHFASGRRFSSFGMRSSPAFRQHAFAGSRFGRQSFDGRNRTFARGSANWDRRHDHFSGGHRFRFVNGNWIIFDDGFYPYGFYPPYPYGYYPYGYYPYNYGNY